MENFGFTSVLRGALLIWRDHFLAITVVAFLGSAPYLAFAFASYQGAQQQAPPLEIVFLLLLCEQIMLATIAALALRSHKGAVVAALTSAGRRALSQMLPVVTTGIVLNTALVFTQLHPIFIVGYFVLAVLLMPALPVAVAEGPSGLSALSTSVELTRGYRWQVLGLVVIPDLLLLGFTALLQATVESSLQDGAVLGIMLGARVLRTTYVGVLAAAAYRALRQRIPRPDAAEPSSW